MKILIINASVRNERSYSRKLTRLFVENWKTKYPLDTFTYREAGTDNIPNIDESWIAGAFKKPADRTEENQKALQLSNELIQAQVVINLFSSIRMRIEDHWSGSSSFFWIKNSDLFAVVGWAGKTLGCYRVAPIASISCFWSGYRA